MSSSFPKEEGFPFPFDDDVLLLLLLLLLLFCPKKPFLSLKLLEGEDPFEARKKDALLVRLAIEEVDFFIVVVLLALEKRGIVSSSRSPR